MSFAFVMLIALCVDVAIGWPQALFSRIGHPVTWIGAMITRLDTRWNLDTDTPSRRRRRGMLVSLSVIAVATLPAFAVSLMLPDTWLGLVLTGLLAAPLVAARSLHEHVSQVQRPLAAGDVAQARTAVSRIVGRDPTQLQASGIARAAIESLAENTSDGVTAPLFWGLLLGLPGIAAYKAINTLDSMIGYRTDRYGDFGRFAARLDDAVNWIPARATGFAFAALSGHMRRAIGVMQRDAGLHRSPNAGWPEAAMAAGIHVRLSGPRVYDARLDQQPWVNAEAPDPTAQALGQALSLYRRTLVGLFGVLLLLALL